MLPHIVAGMVAIVEHGFFYAYTVDGLFEEFSARAKNPTPVAVRAPLMSKMFLWHFSEEREHSEESTYLFHQHYGVFSVPLLLIASPLIAVFFW